MANIPVVTSPRGVWPAETVSVDETVVAQVQAALLRLPTGTIAEMRDATFEADNREKVTHDAPKIVTALVDVEDAVVADDNVAFTVEFTGDPVPEVRWYGVLSGVSTLYVDGGVAGTANVDITTTSGQSVLTLSNLVEGQDGTTIRVEVRNYKGAAASEATLAVAEA